MNEKDNETSRASGEETENLGSGPIPEKEGDLPEGETVVAYDEESVEASDKEPEKEVEVEPETSGDEEPVVAYDEESVEASDEEPEKEVEVEPETSGDEEPVAISDEERMAVSDKEPKEDIEVSPETSWEEEPVVAYDEESVEASDEEPKQEVEIEPETPVKEEIPVEKEPKTTPEPIPVIKEEPKEAPPKEVVIIKEVEKKPNKFIKKIKRTVLVIILVIALALAGTMYAWTSGMDDLRDDNDYLIVVVFKEAEAASIYHKDTGESEIIEVTELEKISNRKLFFESAQKNYGVLDRMIIIDVDTLRKLSTDEYILYKDDPEKKITGEEMYNWIIGKDFPSDAIQGNDSPSVVNANMLKSWLDHYEGKLFGNWGSYTIKVVLNGYRSEKIIIYPGNSALFILKYVAVEKIFFPV
jgi:hypothetical protein